MHHIMRHFGIVLSWTTLVSPRHLHIPPSHKHIRQALVPSTTSANAPAFTAGNVAILDIQNIQDGISNLPGDLLDFVHGVEDRLEQIEDVLQDLVATTTALASASMQSERPAVSTSTASSTEDSSTPFASSTDIASSLFSMSASEIVMSLSTPSMPASSPSSSTSSVNASLAYDTTTRTTHMLTTRTRTVTDETPVTASGPSLILYNSTGNGTHHPSGGLGTTYTVSLALTAPTVTTFPIGIPQVPSILMTASSTET